MAEKILRKKWPLSVVKQLSVRNASVGFDQKCGLEHLEVVASLARGFEFDNYFARPSNERNWPQGFVPAYICNCILYKT